MNVIFPYPDKENSRYLLTQDPEYFKIPAEDVDAVFQRAWDTGAEEALRLAEERGGRLNFFRILEEYGIRLVEKDEDNVAGNTRFYSEFYPKEKKIRLYLRSVQLWCHSHGLSMQDGKQLILAHEFFHYLEYAKLGWTSKQYPVYMIKVGKRTFFRTGISALSEIAANAFANASLPYLELTGVTEEDPVPPVPEQAGTAPVPSLEDLRRRAFWKGGEP